VDISHPLNVDICDLIGNSDIFSALPFSGLATAQDPNECSHHSCSFAELCRREKLPPLKWDLDWDSYRRGYVKNPVSYGLMSGYVDPALKRRIAKLYFPPKKFAPPTNNDPDRVVLCNLRKCIRQAAADGGSPVICIGQSNPNEMRFRCKHWYRRRKTKAYDGSSNNDKNRKHPYNSYCCTFTFTVKWDKFGYYISLLRSIIADSNMGFAWHCCEPPHA
jgi:hypothetical protein